MFFDNNKIAALYRLYRSVAVPFDLLSNTSGTKSDLKPIDTRISPFHLFHLGVFGGLIVRRRGPQRDYSCDTTTLRRLPDLLVGCEGRKYY